MKKTRNNKFEMKKVKVRMKKVENNKVKRRKLELKMIE